MTIGSDFIMVLSPYSRKARRKSVRRRVRRSTAVFSVRRLFCRLQWLGLTSQPSPRHRGTIGLKSASHTSVGLIRHRQEEGAFHHAAWRHRRGVGIFSTTARGLTGGNSARISQSGGASSACELHGGSHNFNAAATYARVVALTNNVLNRVPFSLGSGADTT